MEESEKRRDRLKAMRMEAAQADVSNTAATSLPPNCLSNPLVETSSTVAVEQSFSTPRFDFYTDPMAAFSGNKKRSTVPNQIYQNFTPPSISRSHLAWHSPSSPYGPRNPEMNSSPSNQFQSNYSPQQQIFHAQPPYHSFTPSRSPVRMNSPFPGHQGNDSYGPPHYYNNPTNSSRGGNIRSPGFQPAGSPSFSHGRGRGQRGGRGIGSHGQVSARDRPELFYNKSMVEDPWKFLKPVIWSRRDVKLKNYIATPESLKSAGMKKARVTEGNSGSSSQPSLAEYLAASLNEAVSDGPG